jgi:hypothetical protein
MSCSVSASAAVAKPPKPTAIADTSAFVLSALLDFMVIPPIDRLRVRRESDKRMSLVPSCILGGRWCHSNGNNADGSQVLRRRNCAFNDEYARMRAGVARSSTRDLLLRAHKNASLASEGTDFEARREAVVKRRPYETA